MAVTRISQSSLKQGLKKNKNFVAGIPPILGRYYALASETVGASGATSIEFTNIPQTYKHLQIRVVARELGSSSAGFTERVRFNDNSSTIYSWHYLYGSGVGAVAGNSTSINATYLVKGTGGGAIANAFGCSIIDIFDYSSTSKTKTCRMFGSNDSNGAGTVDIHSGLWASTSAINKIVLDKLNGNNWAQYTTAALYGIK